MLVTPITGTLKQEEKASWVTQEVADWLGRYLKTNKLPRFRLWRSSHHSFSFLSVEVWVQPFWGYPPDMGMLYHSHLSHSRTKSHIPGEPPPPQGEAAEPKGRENLPQDKAPRCLWAPRVFMGLRTALEIWRRLELLRTMPDRSTEGENGTSPNPWLELTLGVEKNHQTNPIVS